MITGTSVRAARAFGNSSRPLSRHVDVGENQNQGGASHISDAPERRAARPRKLHQEALRFQVMPEPLPDQQLDIWFIINDENEDAHPRSPAFPRDAAVAGQNDSELGELTRLCFDFDRACMLVDDDVMAERQAEARSLSRRLRCEERGEHLGLHLRGHAGAVVADP